MDKARLIDYLRKNLSLTDPNVENDPAYQFSDEDLQDILEMKALERGYTFSNLPTEEIPLVMLLAKKEVLWRLALSSAPFYPISSEGAGLQKNVRFDHYMALIKQLEIEYQNLLATGQYINIGRNIGEILLEKKYFSRRNKALAENKNVLISVDKVGTDYINISWEVPNLNKLFFYRYKIYVDTKPIIDDYADEVINEKALLKVIEDVRRTKFRIKDLQSDMEYYIVVAVLEQNGLISYTEVKTKTSASEVIEE